MNIPIPPDAVREDFMRAGGPGGQNVNKVETAVQLRIETSQLILADDFRARLQLLAGTKMTASGTLILKSQQFRTQDANRKNVWAQWHDLVQRASVRPKPRKPTKVSRAAKQKRLDAKKRRGDVKSLRRDVD